jgi:hypothetical protein
MVLVTIIMVGTAVIVGKILKAVVAKLDRENEKREIYEREKTDKKD